MIVVVDFGGQTAHLIGRRVRELGSPVTIVSPFDALAKIQEIKPNGIILSGGPSSVYEKGAPTVDAQIFSLGIPLLGICYGLQLMAKLLGGKVVAGKKEYGPAKIKLETRNSKSEIENGLPQSFTVWMSHGDEVTALPKGFKTVGSSNHVPFAFVADTKNNLYGVQFHPEVEHTENGIHILQNFLSLCNIQSRMQVLNIGDMIQSIRDTVHDSYVIGAISGGVDSTVAGVLTARAISKKFIPVFVDNGFMRPDARETVQKIFTDYGIKPDIAKVEREMLSKLKGISDPEKKRKVIGNFYIEVFEREMKKQIKKGRDVRFLLQGTIYSDVIESQGTKHAAKIKSHHNVGGLPAKMKLKLLEPLRELYKDEVRKIGAELGLPEEFVWKQPFPGPGYAIRIRGEVTADRLKKEKMADIIVLDELKKAGWLEKVFISFPIMSGTHSTAVKGDGRFFGEVIALRVVESKDVMTSTWSRLPYEVLQSISSRIVNEVPGISRVVYDISTKPPATMEWE